MAMTYTVEEFLEDCDALLGKRPEGHEASDEEGGFYAKVGQVFEYMSAKYSDRGDETFKFRASRFMVALGCLAENASVFDQGDYSVFGSDEVGGLVGAHTLRALHSVFMGADLPSPDPDPETIMRLADSFRDEDSN